MWTKAWTKRERACWGRAEAVKMRGWTARRGRSAWRVPTGCWRSSCGATSGGCCWCASCSTRHTAERSRLPCPHRSFTAQRIQRTVCGRS